jgi:hypothetical protein
MTTAEPYGPLQGAYEGHDADAGDGPRPEAGILDNAQATDDPTVSQHILFD